MNDNEPPLKLDLPPKIVAGLVAMFAVGVLLPSGIVLYLAFWGGN